MLSPLGIWYLPILSSPAFNFVAMSSYNCVCFLQHIRSSASFPCVSSSAVLPSAEGLLRMRLQKRATYMCRTFQRS
ncbi:hypothetical protein DFH94DRAFT_758868 [Russula ochroleuca]|uniref:Uncharacterized protein n=1 Tax=Russula ochroleuca TaxID=152965 RepID=A0A9P5MRS2_9AGAM|nr:hypothetical protein DFH94DRAFT_758868 [Russula ochroleuca]